MRCLGSAALLLGALVERGPADSAAPKDRTQFLAPKSKTPELMNSSGGCFDISLTMSYFHTGTRTIIGAEAFHFPVRDGKEWDHLAMVIRLNWSPGRSHERPSQFTEKFESRYMTASTEGQTTFFDLGSKL